MIDLAVDSAARETVVGIESLQSVQTKRGLASRRGTEHEVANGDRIPNLGEKQFLGVTTEGVSRQIIAQVRDVNKPPQCVKKIMSAGNTVVFFYLNGSYIEDRTARERMWMKEEGGMFMLRMWVKKGPFF